jgi:hypothetical protein
MINKNVLNRQIEVDLESFLLHGGIVTVLKAKKPRKSERVISRPTKSYADSVGAKALTLQSIGIMRRV